MEFKAPDSNPTAYEAVAYIRSQLMKSGVATQSVESQAAFVAIEELARRIDKMK